MKDRNFLIKLFAVINLTIIVSCKVYAQPYPGFTLYTAASDRTDLLDLNNNVVKSWIHTRSGGFSVYLLENGDLIRPAVSTNSIINSGGAGGIVQKYNWQGNLIWEFTYSSNTYRSHHDICALPNGNVLLIAWEVKTPEEAVKAGLNHNAEIWPDHIIEVQPSGPYSGNIVWEWHFWDHLIQDFDSTKENYGIVSEHPELLDLNIGSEGSGDWMHCNALSYNARLDQIMFSSYELDEIFIIDHSTTTAEAASHSGGRYGKGGDLLYRWGKSTNYDIPGKQFLDVAHNSIWIPDSIRGGGEILIFNNGQNLKASSVLQLVPPVDSAGYYFRNPGEAFGPANPEWTFSSKGFYTNIMGGCQRLPNRNTLIAESTSGNLFEVNYSGEIVWGFTPGGLISRVLRYGFDYPGLSELVMHLRVKAIPEGFYDKSKGNLNSSDTFKIFLREIKSPYSISDSDQAVIDKNTIEGIFHFGNAGEGKYFLELEHRNCIESWSSLLVSLNKGQTGLFDFTSSVIQTYGMNSVRVDSVPVRYAVYSGDVNGDGVVDATDMSLIDNDAFIFASGYLKTDLTGDNVIDASDAVYAENNSYNFVGKITP